MKPFLAALALAALAAACALDASAQRFPGRDRGDFQRRDREPRKDTAPRLHDPFDALDRELPSLKVDLMLTAQQVGAWSLFERDVRAVADLERTHRRYLFSLRDPGDKPPSAQALFARLAQDDRGKADACADAQRHFEALYALLDPKQRAMIDRRVLLSQSEPLGEEREAPKR